jgi:hypothetical protein
MKNGRKLIGWDEILEGGLSPNATVQSWRGMDGGLEAARTEHDVIMSPTSHCYLDYSLRRLIYKKSTDLIQYHLNWKKNSTSTFLGANVISGPNMCERTKFRFKGISTHDCFGRSFMERTKTT